MPFDGGPYDSIRFSIEPRSCDQEHCDSCGEHNRLGTFRLSAALRSAMMLRCGVDGMRD